MRKSLRILCMALALCLLPASGALAAETGIEFPEPAGTVTGQCTVTMPEGLADKAYRITDTLVETYQVLPKKSQVTVDLPEAAQGIYLEWYAFTDKYTVEQQDASGAVLSMAEAQPYLNCWYPLDENARRVCVYLDGEASLSGLRVYGGETEPPAELQIWTPAPERADMLIVAATPEDAIEDFYGVIAAYGVEHQVPVALTVLSPGTRTSANELLAALWDMGVRTYPDMGNFTCVNNGFYKMVKASWGKKDTKKYIAAKIERYQPQVVVTHDDSEASATGATRFAGEYAVLCAEDAEVRKVYTVSPEGSTTLDMDRPLIAAGGLTAGELVAKAYKSHVSSQPYKQSVTPNTVFRLAESQVGQDSACDDLLENIDKTTLTAYVDPSPTPEPTPEATPEPTIAPTAAPEEQPAEQPAGREPASSGVDAVMRIFNVIPAKVLLNAILIFAGGLVLTLLTLLITFDRIKRGHGGGAALLIGLIPLIVGIAVALALCLLNKKQPVKQADPPASQAPAATEAPAAPEETPAAEAAGEPEPDAPDQKETEAAGQGETAEGTGADSAYYRGMEDPEELILVDVENGHWEYRTDTLSILIDRFEKEGPLVYFVADIRMRDVDALRAGQAADNRNGLGVLKPWIMARRNKAVLMITGDNLIHMDTEYKSILIRDGAVFQDEDADPTPTLAMYPDLSMRVYPRNTTTAEELLMDGVRQAFSFGPTLVENGAVNPDADDNRLGRINPRTGLGMIEPGRFIAIVADGRQPEYSVGMLLSDFAQLFADYGCTTAYNLDGGVSTCMVFMGEQLNHHGDVRVGTYEDTYQRRITDGLIWGYSDQVPSEDDPILNRGEP